MHKSVALKERRFPLTNLEVARGMLTNAIAYGEKGDLQTVMHNLEYIQTLLEEPNEENKEKSWDDFK